MPDGPAVSRDTCLVELFDDDEDVTYFAEDVARRLGCDAGILNFLFSEQDAARFPYESLARLSPVLPQVRRLLDDQPHVDVTTLASLVVSLETGTLGRSGKASPVHQPRSRAGVAAGALFFAGFFLVLPALPHLIPCNSACRDCSANVGSKIMLQVIGGAFFAVSAIIGLLPGLLAIRRAASEHIPAAQQKSG